MKVGRCRVSRLAWVGFTLVLLAGCGGAAPRPQSGESDGAQGASGGGDFMGVTRARCAQGDDGACRILRAMGS